jgi:hypothetical protein
MNNKNRVICFFIGLGLIICLSIIFLFLNRNSFDAPSVEYKYAEIESPKEVVDEYIQELEDIIQYMSVSQLDDYALYIEIKERIMGIKTPAQYRDAHMQLFLSIDKEEVLLRDKIQKYMLKIQNKK